RHGDVRPSGHIAHVSCQRDSTGYRGTMERIAATAADRLGGNHFVCDLGGKPVAHLLLATRHQTRAEPRAYDTHPGRCLDPGADPHRLWRPPISSTAPGGLYLSDDVLGQYDTRPPRHARAHARWSEHHTPGATAHARRCAE